MTKEKKPSNLSTPLSKYKREGKKLLPPLAQLDNLHNSSWINDRFPAMLWVALIISSLDREKYMRVFYSVFEWLRLNKQSLNGLTLSDIEEYPDHKRKEFLQLLIGLDPTMSEILRPLLLFEQLPAHKSWQEAIGVTADPKEDWQRLAQSVYTCFSHQAQGATDSKWVRLMGLIIIGKMQFTARSQESVEGVLGYPKVGDQRRIQPFIRSSEIALASLIDPKWPRVFWEACRKDTDCIAALENDKELREEYPTISEKAKCLHSKQAPQIRGKLIEHFFQTASTTAIDSRHESVFGLAFYALDMFIESNIMLTSTGATGRLHNRAILEAYFQLAFLLKKENLKKPIWDQYRQYGSGKLHLIWKKLKEEGMDASMISMPALEYLANEDKMTEFASITVGNWVNMDLRKISNAIGENKMYEKYYGYVSGYIHADWGAIREASFQLCLNPLHRMHRIPNYRLPTHLPGSGEDNRLIVNKILRAVDKSYPEFKHRFKKPQS